MIQILFFLWTNAYFRLQNKALKMRRIKLLWDFFGPDAWKTAEHFEHHLKEFIEMHDLDITETGFKDEHENHSISFMVIDESQLLDVRDPLKPHRAILVEE